MGEGLAQGQIWMGRPWDWKLQVEHSTQVRGRSQDKPDSKFDNCGPRPPIQKMLLGSQEHAAPMSDHKAQSPPTSSSSLMPLLNRPPLQPHPWLVWPAPAEATWHQACGRGLHSRHLSGLRTGWGTPHLPAATGQPFWLWERPMQLLQAPLSP